MPECKLFFVRGGESGREGPKDRLASFIDISGFLIIMSESIFEPSFPLSLFPTLEKESEALSCSERCEQHREQHRCNVFNIIQISYTYLYSSGEGISLVMSYAN